MVTHTPPAMENGKGRKDKGIPKTLDGGVGHTLTLVMGKVRVVKTINILLPLGKVCGRGP